MTDKNALTEAVKKVKIVRNTIGGVLELKLTDDEANAAIVAAVKGIYRDEETLQQLIEFMQSGSHYHISRNAVVVGLSRLEDALIAQHGGKP